MKNFKKLSLLVLLSLASTQLGAMETSKVTLNDVYTKTDKTKFEQEKNNAAQKQRNYEKGLTYATYGFYATSASIIASSFFLMINLLPPRSFKGSLFVGLAATIGSLGGSVFFGTIINHCDAQDFAWEKKEMDATDGIMACNIAQKLRLQVTPTLNALTLIQQKKEYWKKKKSHQKLSALALLEKKLS